MLLLPLNVLAEAGGTPKSKCEAIDLLAITTTVQPWSEIPNHPTPGIVVSAPPGVDANDDDRTVTVDGPVLSVMESSQVATSLTCTGDGVRVVAILTRSERSLVDLAKNTPWRARLILVVRLMRPSATLDVVWKIRLKSGEFLTRATTPGYDEQIYPIIQTTRLAASRK